MRFRGGHKIIPKLLHIYPFWIDRTPPPPFHISMPPTCNSNSNSTLFGKSDFSLAVVHADSDAWVFGIQ